MVDFTVNDMTCNHCASTITKAVKEVDPAAKLEFDLGAKRVRIDSSHEEEELRVAIEDAGFTPKLAAARE